MKNTISDKVLNSEESQTARLKYKYRQLIQRGRVKIPHKNAVKLIGPDCAYHLYNRVNLKNTDGS